jgi:prepilin-type N-terminal cleavage/methylation domain-containing protein
MPRAERGVALLEVLVAVAILGTAAIGFVGLVAGGTQATIAAQDRERQLADEERLLAAYTLLARKDLDRRLGTHAVGVYLVEVQRPERTLYRIAIAHEQSPQVEDLVTVVYRLDTSDAR